VLVGVPLLLQPGTSRPAVGHSAARLAASTHSTGRTGSAARSYARTSVPSWELVRFRQADPAASAPSATTTTTAPPVTTTTTAPPVTTTTTAPPVTTTTTTPPAPLPQPAAAPAPAPAPSNSESGEATWYSEAPPGMCASPTLAFGTVLTVTNVATGASTTCTVDDREADNPGRVVDMSYSGFSAIADPGQGVVTVTISW
jgi:rare lipoprotein A (peptidoglycan hydrolase)